MCIIALSPCTYSIALGHYLFPSIAFKRRSLEIWDYGNGNGIGNGLRFTVGLWVYGLRTRCSEIWHGTAFRGIDSCSTLGVGRPSVRFSMYGVGFWFLNLASFMYFLSY
jgi:hypothetical protein